MVVDWLFRLTFVLYCVAVGVTLVYLPWTDLWPMMVRYLPPQLHLLDSSYLRGALTGFGLVHLCWVLNEFDQAIEHQAP